MTTNILLPHKFKRPGWILLIPSVLTGLLITIYNYEPSQFDLYLPTIFVDNFVDENQLVGMVKNNFLNEIVGILILISSILVAFSKEKIEDEYIFKLRLESLVWAVYLNCLILFLSILFIFDFTFLWVMIFNMYTVLWFFIIRFSYLKNKLKKNSEK